MLSRRSVYQVSQFVCDLLALAAAWYITVFLRVLLNPSARVSVLAENANQWAMPLGWILAVWTVAAMFRGVYVSPVRLEVRTGIRRAGQTTVMVMLVTTSVMFFATNFSRDTSRSFMLIFSPLSFVFLAGSRFAARSMATRLVRDLPVGDNIAVFGDYTGAVTLFDRLRRQSEQMFVRGVILPAEERLAEINDSRVLGTIEDLAMLINREQIGQIILVNSGIAVQDVAICSEVSLRMGVTMSWALYSGKDSEEEIPIVDSVPGLTPWQQTAKRLLDVTLSFAALVVLAPLMILIALVVKLTSPGPVFYCSPRVGRGGRHFTFLKFRSMRLDGTRTAVSIRNEKDGHIFKIRRDPRVTPAGRIMRRLSLDELPQLINVLRGDMSLVGPRPLPAEDLGPDGMSPKFVIWSRQRSRTRPGITGLWQIRGRSNLPFDDMVRYDQEYVRDWSLILDLVILAKTPLLVLVGNGAY